MRADIAEFVKNAQKESFLQEVEHGLNGKQRQTQFHFAGGGVYTLAVDGDGNIAATIGHETTVPYHKPAKAGATPAAMATQSSDDIVRPIIYREEGMGAPRIIHAASARIRAEPQNESNSIHVNIDLEDCLQTVRAADGSDEFPAASKKISMSFD